MRFARRGFCLLAALLCGCAGVIDPAVRVSGPAARTSAAAVQLRLLEDGRGTDLERARKVLARFFAGPRGERLFLERELAVSDLPAPAGCAWVGLEASVTLGSAFETPLGTVSLCRIDDGLDLTLADFETITMQQSDDRSVLRMRIRTDRRAALTELINRAGGSVLLFVQAGRVQLIARVDGPLGDELLLQGIDEGSAARFARRIADR